MWKALRHRVTLRTCNDFLSCIIVLLGLYIIAMPFLPQLAFWWQGRFYEPPAYVLQATSDKPSTPTAASRQLPKNNTLVIPKLHLEQTIHEGATARTLREGVWRLPHTSTPETQSNTVMVAHRFTYDGPATFYHLDKLQVGDQIFVYWDGKPYEYTVRASRVVSPETISVEAPTDTPTLTLYTCTPLWSAKDRLVIIATTTKEAL